MNQLLDTLHECLSGLTVRAWRLHLETPGTRATVPMLRGVWGAALHRLDVTLYQALFEGGVSRTPGYLMRPAPPDARPAPAVDFVLFGTADPALEEWVWNGWEHALRAGLGPSREPARLVRVCPLAWDGTALSPSRRQPGFRLYPLPWPVGEPNRPCLLRFPAPLRLLRDGRLIARPGLPDLTLAALRRVYSVMGERGERLWVDRHAWLKIARDQPAGPWRGQPLDLVRWSARQQEEVELRGVAGELPLPAGPGPLADLLAAAQWLHLGKGTVMGLGQVEIWPSPVADEP